MKAMRTGTPEGVAPSGGPAVAAAARISDGRPSSKKGRATHAPTPRKKCRRLRDRWRCNAASAEESGFTGGSGSRLRDLERLGRGKRAARKRVFSWDGELLRGGGSLPVRRGKAAFAALFLKSG